MGGQGVLAIPNVYNGWVQKLPGEWKELLTREQRNPLGDNSGGGGGNKSATITVESEKANGDEFTKWVEISDPDTSEIVKQGFTPLVFQGSVGEKYRIEVRYSAAPLFSHWEDGSDERWRILTLQKDVTLVATFGGSGGNKTATVTIESEKADGSNFTKWVEIRAAGTGEVVEQGFTPVVFDGLVGEEYVVEIRYDSTPKFSHWEDGSDERKRTITVSGDVTLTATYGED
jgi:hypothetical protein